MTWLFKSLKKTKKASKKMTEELLNQILTCDKVINGILADIASLPECEIVENQVQDQHFKNRKLLEIKT